MNLLRTLFWAAIFVGATFAFTVLFEHGPMDFGENAKKEAETLRAMLSSQPAKRADDSDKLTPPLH